MIHFTQDDDGQDSWPPRGWNQFEDIIEVTGQSVEKDLESSVVQGLNYCIHSDPVTINESVQYIHSIHIHSWQYDIRNDIHETPVLSLSLMDYYDSRIPREGYVSNIRSMGTSVDCDERSVRRAITATLFFLKQIRLGQVPDSENTLSIYRLHPSQLKMMKPRIYKKSGIGSLIFEGLIGKDKKSV